MRGHGAGNYKNQLEVLNFARNEEKRTVARERGQAKKRSAKNRIMNGNKTGKIGEA